MREDLRPPFRQQFDSARDPYSARNALGITSTGGGGPSGGAPDDAQYIVAASDPTLTAERVLTNTATVTWDFSTAGQAKANTAAGGGNVSNSGTPAANDVAQWVTATTIKGVALNTWRTDPNFINIATVKHVAGGDGVGLRGLSGQAWVYGSGASADISLVLSSKGNAAITFYAGDFTRLCAQFTSTPVTNTFPIFTSNIGSSGIANNPAGNPIIFGSDVQLTTGSTAVTQTAGDSSTKIATTAFVAAAAGGAQPLDADLTAIAALTGTNTIYYRSAANTWSPVVVSTGLSFTGGTLTATGGTPGGANTQVQFNDSSAFGGDADLTWNKTTNVLTLTGQLAVNIGNATSIVTAGVIEAGSGFRQTGSFVTLGPATSGQILLRPAGLVTTTGQINITTTNITTTTPVTLPADPTANLQAATKQYVDNKSFQPLDGDLTALAALGGTNTIYYRSGADTWSPVVVSTGLAFSGGNLTATGGGAPTNAEYITSSTNATLSAERVLTNTATITWDFATAGQAKANTAATATNDNAAAGKIGEYIIGDVAYGSRVSLATGVKANITSISLTAGDWDVALQGFFDGTPTVNATYAAISISLVSATMNYANDHVGIVTCPHAGLVGASNSNWVANVPMCRISLASTTTVYFVAEATFTVSTLSAYGAIMARRVR